MLVEVELVEAGASVEVVEVELVVAGASLVELTVVEDLPWNLKFCAFLFWKSMVIETEAEAEAEAEEEDEAVA